MIDDVPISVEYIDGTLFINKEYGQPLYNEPTQKDIVNAQIYVKDDARVIIDYFEPEKEDMSMEIEDLIRWSRNPNRRKVLYPNAIKCINYIDK